MSAKFSYFNNLSLPSSGTELWDLVYLLLGRYSGVRTKMVSLLTIFFRLCISQVCSTNVHRNNSLMANVTS